MSNVPIKINGKHLYQIMCSSAAIAAYATKIGRVEAAWTTDDIFNFSIEQMVYPSEVSLSSETYSRNAERTADYELEQLQIVNRKSKPEVTWNLIKAEYVQKLMAELDYKYDFKVNGEIQPEEAPNIAITYNDFIGIRTIQTYLGQTIDGTLVEYDGVMYWESFRIAFPER